MFIASSSSASFGCASQGSSRHDLNSPSRVSPTSTSSWRRTQAATSSTKRCSSPTLCVGPHFVRSSSTISAADTGKSASLRVHSVNHLALLRERVHCAFRLVSRDDEQKFCEICFAREVCPEIGRWWRLFGNCACLSFKFLRLPVAFFRGKLCVRRWPPRPTVENARHARKWLSKLSVCRRRARCPSRQSCH